MRNAIVMLGVSCVMTVVQIYMKLDAMKVRIFLTVACFRVT